MRKSLTKILAFIVFLGVVALGALSLVGCSTAGNEASSSSSASSSAQEAAEVEVTEEGDDVTVTEEENGIKTTVEADDPYGSGIHHVEMKVEGYAPITIELNSDAAPVTVSNFVSLVKDGYYDGLSFYRFQDGFCMQGGSAGNSASGNDSSLTPIIGEFSDNGVSNPLADDFGYGTVAMARTTDPDSATSTFFVTLGDGEEVGLSLNGQYAAFGTIDDAGMKVIEKIVSDRKAADKDQMGIVTDDGDQAMIESITVID